MPKSNTGETRFAVVVVAAACSLATGCETLSDVNGSDYHAFSPSLRVAWELNGSPGEGSTAQPHSGRAIEMFLADSSGEGTQGLETGQSPIKLGGVQFDPPQTIHQRFDVSVAELTHRWRAITGTVGIEVFVGIGYRTFGTTLDTGAQRAQQNHDGGYVPGGVGGIWNIAPRTSLQARITSGFSQHFSFNRGEVAVAQGLTKRTALRVGWMSWDVQHSFDVESDVRLKLAGPTLGLAWEF